MRQPRVSTDDWQAAAASRHVRGVPIRHPDADADDAFSKQKEGFR